jgi:hypothetical protein
LRIEPSPRFVERGRASVYDGRVRVEPLVFVAALALAAGCSLPRGVLAPADGVDASVTDAWVDPDALPLSDAGTPDAALDDAAPSDAACLQGCDGNSAVTCNLGHQVVTVCNATICDPTGAFPMCLPLICVADESTCSTDGTSDTVCNHYGTVQTTNHCDRGCSGTTCRAPLACSETITGTIAMSGTFQIGLCGAGNNHTDSGSHGDCTSAIANGEDVMYRLELDHTQRVMITQADASTSRNVDPIVYLRSACATRSSEIDCNDNGSASSAMLDEVLQAGEYFVIFDSFDDATHACGTISITTSFSPP